MILNKYKAFFRGRSIDIDAETSYAARCKAARIFKARKAYSVAVILCELQGKQVTIDPAAL